MIMVRAALRIVQVLMLAVGFAGVLVSVVMMTMLAALFVALMFSCVIGTHTCQWVG